MQEHECQDSWFCFGCFQIVCGCEVSFLERHDYPCNGKVVPKEDAFYRIFKVLVQIKKTGWEKVVGILLWVAPCVGAWIETMF